MNIPIRCTLLDLVHTLNTITNSDQEVVALAETLVNSGRVQLCGNFAGATITLPSSPSPFSVAMGSEGAGIAER
jgi:hypothetical protein